MNDTSDHFRIVSAPDDSPGRKNWTEVVPDRPDVIIDDHNVFAHHLVVSERRGGITQIAIARLGDDANEAEVSGKFDHELKFDEPDFHPIATRATLALSSILRSFASLTHR